MSGFYKFFSLSLLLIFLYVGVNAQRVTISGKIADELTGEALIGANVVIKGTTVGSATDIDGVYKFDIKDTSEITIVISYIGYQDKEITLTHIKQLFHYEILLI